MSPTELDCRSCGACCLSMGDGGDVLHRGYADLTAKDVAQLSSHVRRQLQEVSVCGKVRHATRPKQLPSGTYACRHLRGTLGERCSCSIYSTRPEVCRNFSVGGVASTRRSNESDHQRMPIRLAPTTNGAP